MKTEERMSDCRQVAMLEDLGISHYRVWCPDCEYSDKRWFPAHGLCTGRQEDPHEARPLRNSIVWADGTGSDVVIGLECARKILEQEFEGTHNAAFAVRAIRDAVSS